MWKFGGEEKNVMVAKSKGKACDEDLFASYIIFLDLDTNEVPTVSSSLQPEQGNRRELQGPYCYPSRFRTFGDVTSSCPFPPVRRDTLDDTTSSS